MKPKNFPGRVNERRREALARIEAKYGELLEDLDWRKKHLNIVFEVATLRSLILPSADHIRTKKDRTARGKLRREG